MADLDKTGKVYSTYFRKYKVARDLISNGKFFSVTRGRGWKRWLGNEGIIWEQGMAPSQRLLERVRPKDEIVEPITWDAYREEYLIEMSMDVPQKLITKLAQEILDGFDIVLMCYEKRGEPCHRHLLVDLVIERVRDLKFGFGLFKIQSPNGGEIVC